MTERAMFPSPVSCTPQCCLQDYCDCPLCSILASAWAWRCADAMPDKEIDQWELEAETLMMFELALWGQR